MPSTAQHPLARYLERKHISLGDFSRLTGIAKETLSRVFTGRRSRFSAEHALLIEETTKGKVRFRDCWSPSVKHLPGYTQTPRRPAAGRKAGGR